MSTKFIGQFTTGYRYGYGVVVAIEVDRETDATYIISGTTPIIGMISLGRSVSKRKWATFDTAREAIEFVLGEANKWAEIKWHDYNKAIECRDKLQKALDSVEPAQP